MKLAIITPGGLTNFGERAIMLGTVYELRAQHPKAIIAIFGYEDLKSEDPHLFAELHSLGVVFYPSLITGHNRITKLLRVVSMAFLPRLFLPAKSYRFLRQAEVYAKGQESLTQDYGLTHFVDSVLEPLLVSRLTRRITLFGHSIGPVYKHAWFARWAVKRFARIWVRDSRSETALLNLSYDPTRIKRIKDLAYAAVARYAPALKSTKKHYLLVPNAAICTSPQRTDEYMTNLRQIITELLKQNAQVIVGSSVTADDWNSDYRLCRQLKKEFPKLVLKEYRYLQEFLADVKNARQVISSRLHPLIMATGIGTDVLALSRSPKVAGLLGDLGLQTVDPFKTLQLEQLPLL
ncbi:MAG TPA: polysaccharide pyruvyl transferase family protein [Candidatus Saccharimonadales bacterium]|nr:polysaccharide pyruvyl transferase family protein [Candidatus Saccharimonadales bacterium]